MFFPTLCHSSLLAALLLGGVCSASPVKLTARQAEWHGVRPTKPSDDKWYTEPGVSESLLASLSPGTVLASRAVEIPYELSFTHSQAWQVKFRTTDSRFNATWAVTTLYTPLNRNPKTAMVSYQHFYDSAEVDDSPSYGIYTGVYYWLWVVNGLAQKHPNWYINMPDYEGNGASFAAGLMSGHATLDSIRAVKALGRSNSTVGLTEAVPVAMWGYSGGALATEWAAELAGHYAPELNITVAVMGGLTPNITNLFGTLSGEHADPPRAKLIWQAVRGLAVQYPELVQPALIAATSTKEKNTTSWDAAVQLLWDATELGDKFATLKRYVENLLRNCGIQKILSVEGLMGYNGGVPQMPLIIHHAEFDELAPIRDVVKLARRYCGLSRAVNLSLFIDRRKANDVNKLGMHEDEAVRGKDQALDKWLPEAFAGENLPVGCTQYWVHYNWSEFDWTEPW